VFNTRIRLRLFAGAAAAAWQLVVLQHRIRTAIHRPLGRSHGLPVRRLPWREALQLLLMGILARLHEPALERERRWCSLVFHRLDSQCLRYAPQFSPLRSDVARSLQDAAMAAAFWRILKTRLCERTRMRLAHYPTVSRAIRDVLELCGARCGVASLGRVQQQVDFFAAGTEVELQRMPNATTDFVRGSSELEQLWRSFAEWESRAEANMTLVELHRVADGLAMKLVSDALASVHGRDGEQIGGVVERILACTATFLDRARGYRPPAALASTQTVR
jgi:hypothetical protein